MRTAPFHVSTCVIMYRGGGGTNAPCLFHVMLDVLEDENNGRRTNTDSELFRIFDSLADEG